MKQAEVRTFFLLRTFEDDSVGSLSNLLNLYKVLKFVTRGAGTHGGGWAGDQS